MLLVLLRRPTAYKRRLRMPKPVQVTPRPWDVLLRERQLRPAHGSGIPEKIARIAVWERLPVEPDGMATLAEEPSDLSVPIHPVKVRPTCWNCAA